MELNPDFNWWKHAGNSLQDIGYGLSRSPTIGAAFGTATQNSAREQPARDAKARLEAEDAEKKKALADQAALRTKYADYFRTQGKPQVAQGIADGIIDPAQAYWDHISPKAVDPVRGIEINGRLVNPVTGELMGDYSDGGGANVPSGYQLTPDGSGLMPTPGGPADPKNPLNLRKMNPPPNATVQKEILETDEAIQAGENVISSLDRALKLNKTSKSGFGADFFSTIGANVPDWVPVAGGDASDIATQELKNIVTAQALESLKATFGAAPTEGERKILLEVQGSVDQPEKVREAIFKRAQAAAQRRLAFNRDKAAKLRSGGYFTEGGAPGADGTDDISDLLNKYGQ